MVEGFQNKNPLATSGGPLPFDKGRKSKEKNMDLIVEGIFDANERGFGFVSVIDEEMEDIFIPPASVNNAFNGDKVEVRITSKGSDGRSAEGIITKIFMINF